MLLKCIGIIILMAACGMFGFSLSYDYIMRMKNLEQLRKMLLLLQGEIKHKNSGISEAIKNVSIQMENGMGDFLKYVSQKFRKENITIKAAWNMGIDDFLKKRSKLIEKDLTIIRELGGSLGVTDRETQIHNIHNCMDIIGITINELNVAKGEKCRLYRTLGVMAGAFMAIVFI